jgi:hypothetical protein
MTAAASPFKNIPQNLDRKQAFFFDGIWHAAEICNLSYHRLTLSLRDIALLAQGSPPQFSSASLFLDAWAFIDAADRFRSLWARQPHADKLPDQFSSKAMHNEFEPIRQVRNVAAHIAARADHVVSLNAAALGDLAWITFTSDAPIAGKTCVIRPGYSNGSFKLQFTSLIGTHQPINSCTAVRIYAGNEIANLTNTHNRIIQVITFAESHLKTEFLKPMYAPPSAIDVLATADLDFEKDASASNTL